MTGIVQLEKISPPWSSSDYSTFIIPPDFENGSHSADILPHSLRHSYATVAGWGGGVSPLQYRKKRVQEEARRRWRRG